MFVEGDFEEMTATTKPLELEEIMEELSNPAQGRVSVYGKDLELLVAMGMPMYENGSKNKK